jgi:hypothetical protein
MPMSALYEVWTDKAAGMLVIASAGVEVELQALSIDKTDAKIKTVRNILLELTLIIFLLLKSDICRIIFMPISRYYFSLHLNFISICHLRRSVKVRIIIQVRYVFLRQKVGLSIIYAKNKKGKDAFYTARMPSCEKNCSFRMILK